MKILKFQQSRFFVIILLILATSCNTLKKYANSATGWENDILAFEKLDKSESYPNNAILFTGSSSIRLWSTIQEDVAPWQVIQRGFGGSKYSDLAWYAERIITPHQYKALVVFVANDITGSPEDKSPDEIIRLANHIVKVSRKHASDKPIFFIEITPTLSRWPSWEKIKAANEALRKYADSEENVYFIQTASHFLNENGEPRNELFMADKLHLNRDGYVIWGKVIKENLDKIVK